MSKGDRCPCCREYADNEYMCSCDLGVCKRCCARAELKRLAKEVGELPTTALAWGEAPP